MYSLFKFLQEPCNILKLVETLITLQKIDIFGPGFHFLDTEITPFAINVINN